MNNRSMWVTLKSDEAKKSIELTLNPIQVTLKPKKKEQVICKMIRRKKSKEEKNISTENTKNRTKITVDEFRILKKIEVEIDDYLFHKKPITEIIYKSYVQNISEKTLSFVSPYVKKYFDVLFEDLEKQIDLDPTSKMKKLDTCLIELIARSISLENILLTLEEIQRSKEKNYIRIQAAASALFIWAKHKKGPIVKSLYQQAVVLTEITLPGSKIPYDDQILENVCYLLRRSIGLVTHFKDAKEIGNPVISMVV